MTQKKARLETSVEEEESRVKEEAEARRQAEAEALNQLRIDKLAKISAVAPADNEEEAARIRQEFDEDLERLKVSKQIVLMAFTILLWKSLLWNEWICSY